MRNLFSELSLDIRTLKRKGCLIPGQKCSWSWKLSDGQYAGNINISTGNNILSLSYRYKYREEEWKPLEMSVEVIGPSVTLVVSVLGSSVLDAGFARRNFMVGNIFIAEFAITLPIPAKTKRK